MNRRYFLGLALSTVALPAAARSDNEKPRVLFLRHLHTNDHLEVAYRVGNHYQRDALGKLNGFLRDFRTGSKTAIDPKLFDLLYDLQRRLGHEDGAFDILSAYRSPQTNSMLRKASRRVARNSLHMSGKALDIRFSGVPVGRVRDAAIALRRGGVGYYPASNFVHVDTGTVRSWRA